ncbi:MAG: hypothetical protein AAGD28_18775 [Bacteroidota bacterium]
MTRFLISTVFLVSSHLFLSPSDIEGKWKGFVKSAIGEIPVSVAYQVEGEVLSGVFDDYGELTPFEGGKISGNSFEYQCSGHGYTFTHKGVVQGDTIHLIWSNLELGEGKGMLIRVD